MTTTPTPLRELIRDAIAGTPSLWDRPTMLSDQQFDDIAARVEAALSARDEAGAVYRCDYCGSDYTRAKYCCQARREYLNAHGEYEIATPPAASGEDWQAKQTAEWLDDLAEEQPRESIAAMYHDAAKLIRRLAAVAPATDTLHSAHSTDGLSAAPAGMDGWQPIETAPKGAKGYAWMRLAWGPEDDKCCGDGMRFGDRFYAVATFHCAGRARSFEFRETEVQPTHWQPLPTPPATAGEE